MTATDLDSNAGTEVKAPEGFVVNFTLFLTSSY